MIGDASEVRRFAEDLGRASSRVAREVPKVVERGALNVKRRMQADAQASHSGHARHFARSISYDRASHGLRGIAFEIGPDKDRAQGALGNLLYFGSAKNAPTLDIQAGLIEEQPRFIKALGDLTSKGLP